MWYNLRFLTLQMLFDKYILNSRNDINTTRASARAARPLRCLPASFARGFPIGLGNCGAE
jgi:hypothetical protein